MIDITSLLFPIDGLLAKIIAVMNNKGGTGKTSTATNLAMVCAQAGKKSLVIDGDQQANSTEVLANGKKYYGQYGPTICDIYNNARADIMDIIVPAMAGDTPIKNLFLLPSDPSFERVMENCMTRHHREKILAKQLQKIINMFDYIFIDCSPGLNLSSTNSAYAADHVLIPIDGGSFSLSGLDVVLDYLDEIREEKFNHFSVFRNEFNASKSVMNEYIAKDLEGNERTKDHFLETRVRTDENIAQAQVACLPLYYYKKGALVLNDYRALMRELEPILNSEAA